MCIGAAGTCTGMMAPGGIPGGTTTWTGNPDGELTTICRPGIMSTGGTRT